MDWRKLRAFANRCGAGWRVILGDTAYPHKMRWHCESGCAPTPCLDCGTERMHGVCLCTPVLFHQREHERDVRWRAEQAALKYLNDREVRYDANGVARLVLK